MGGLRGMTTLVWNRGTRCAGAVHLRGGILRAWHPAPPADNSGLAVQVLATMIIGVRIGMGAGAIDIKCRWHGDQVGDQWCRHTTILLR